MWERHPWLAPLFIAMAAIGGSIMGMPMSTWGTMSTKERLWVFLGNFGFAVFVAPAIGTLLFRVEYSNMQMMGAIVFIGGAGANKFITKIVARLSKQLDEES